MSEVEKAAFNRIMELISGYGVPPEELEPDARVVAEELSRTGVILIIDRTGPKPILSYRV